MRRTVLLLPVAVCAAAPAQVYRRTAPDGTVTFSDRPSPDAERVDVAPAEITDLRHESQQVDSPGRVDPRV